MLVNCDVKGLEVVVAAELSRDKILMQEVRDKLDFHQLNQDRFGLPDRVTAKRFKFKLLYGATAFGYANDSDFVDVSRSEQYWQGIIDEYYDKYKGIKAWHEWLINYAKKHGRLDIPSGRFYPIVPDKTHRGLKWPITVIKNYPVQGFGADLVMLARLQGFKKLKEAGLILTTTSSDSKPNWIDNTTATPSKVVKLISTIHDSIVADCPTHLVTVVGRILNQAVEDIPRLCKQVFGYEFTLPMTSEVQYGPNKRDMKELTF